MLHFASQTLPQQYMCTRPKDSSPGVQGCFKHTDLWGGPFAELRAQLLGASHVLSRWQSECRLLAQDWSMGLDDGGHRWEGQHQADAQVQALLARVDQVRGLWLAALHVWCCRGCFAAVLRACMCRLNFTRVSGARHARTAVSAPAVTCVSCSRDAGDPDIPSLLPVLPACRCTA
jgi:hypothetical protein